MRILRLALMVSALATGAALHSTGSASALPLSPATGVAKLAAQLDQSLPTIEVRYRRGGAVAAGIVGGMILGGIIASQRPYYYDNPPYGYYPPPFPVFQPYPMGGGTVEYCMQRFRSYDPVSMTYLGYDGVRHSCP
jgi:hypothetical protein